MTSTAERTGRFHGPAVLTYGFRPFFLLAGLWAAAAMLLWVVMLSGGTPLPLSLDPISWHAHEFLFGYLGAVIAGFVLTAVPNWTGRRPLAGTPLAGLVLLWLSGRLAIAVSGWLPWPAVAAIDLSLAVALVLFLTREVIQSGNWRNLPVVGLIGLYGLANAVFLAEAAGGGVAFDGVGMRLGLAAAVLLIALIGGRIIPAFTRNWLTARGSARLPQPFDRFDAAVLGLSAVTLLAFVAAPDTAGLRWLMLAAGAAHLWRLSRWCGGLTRAEPLLWVLHVAYAMLALGFVAEAAAGFDLITRAAARHLWLAGAIGLMTVGVMTRATRGHTGRPLQADRPTLLIYLALIGSALLRVAAGLWSDPMPLLHLSAGLWLAAFAGFALAYGPILLRPKPAPGS
ncbi:NnrS family protein [Paracoccus marinaquae]|uniref:NnrS family protein n=1 Tax=Paracoccus marinaquae TaxID=2841926 RepID=A0ABS6AEZ4_9RHOB|nr:NnrS family protein [Paracoccus marinaquae]MBU3029175.1 NnrS family protein [Paracoccus marinaquae]